MAALRKRGGWDGDRVSSHRNFAARCGRMMQEHAGKPLESIIGTRET